MTKFQRIIDWFNSKFSISSEYQGGQRQEFVRLESPVPQSQHAQPAETLRPMEAVIGEPEVAFNHQVNLEAYAKGLEIPADTIERLISAGLLLPDEIKVAEKMIRIMRENHKVF